MSREERPAEQEAVRTTIVGGRLPGSGKAVGPIPRGIEVLVKKAAVDPAFKETLMARRAKAADEIGLKLEPSEAAMLNAVPDAQLETIIANTEVADLSRAAFLGRAAAVMLAALGVSSVTGCSDKDERPTRVPAPAGKRPDVPKTRGVQPDKIVAPGLSAEEIKKRVDATVVLLGSPEQNVRVEAKQALLGMGPAALPALKTAKAPNPAAQKDLKEVIEVLETAKAKAKEETPSPVPPPPKRPVSIRDFGGIRPDSPESKEGK